MRKTCLLCGKGIKVQIRKGTPFCSRDCEKEWDDDEVLT